MGLFNLFFRSLLSLDINAPPLPSIPFFPFLFLFYLCVCVCVSIRDPEKDDITPELDAVSVGFYFLINLPSPYPESLRRRAVPALQREEEIRTLLYFLGATVVALA